MTEARAILPRANVAGVLIDNVSQDEALARIEELVVAGGQHYMVVVNASKLVQARRCPELLQAIRRADLVTADGMSVVWASGLLGCRIKERVTGIDLFEALVGLAARRGYSAYFLGAREQSVRGVVDRSLREHPSLRIAGLRNGYFDPAESASVVEGINRSRADLLFVALSSPAQDVWVAANLAATGARFALGVGGSFDHLSGLQRRAPSWMQRAGLEWLYRLAREPRRLWRRYLFGNVAFMWLIATQFLSSRASKNGG